MPIEKRVAPAAGKVRNTKKAKRPYRYDVCKRGHGMRDPGNVMVKGNGYEGCKTCHREQQRAKNVEKRAVLVRRANRLREFEAVEATRPGNGQLGRQGDMDRVLEVVRLQRDARVMLAAVVAGDRLVGDLRRRVVGLMGENANLVEKRRAGITHHVGRGFVAGMAATGATFMLFTWFLA